MAALARGALRREKARPAGPPSPDPPASFPTDTELGLVCRNNVLPAPATSSCACLVTYPRNIPEAPPVGQGQAGISASLLTSGPQLTHSSRLAAHSGGKRRKSDLLPPLHNWICALKEPLPGGPRWVAEAASQGLAGGQLPGGAGGREGLVGAQPSFCP